MADGINIDVLGLSDIKATLDSLSKEAGDRAIRKALKAGAEIEKAAIEERAVFTTTGGALPEGALAADISYRIVKNSDGVLFALVGPGKLTAWVAKLVEYGHRIVTGGRSRLLTNGKSRGPGKVHATNVPAHAFIRPAYESSQQSVSDAICTTLATAVEQEASKGK